MAKLKDAKDALKKYFGYDFFRPMQEDVIQSVLSGRDSLVLMPTGGGKSITYQIPGIIRPGFCVVISPLIALMADQVQALSANGVPAAFLNSTLSERAQLDIEEEVMSGEIKLLYVSPEKLLSNGFVEFLKMAGASMFAIDEAHCISAWGHDFRPEYTELKIIRDEFPGVPLLACTATADKLTRKDIIKQLAMRDPDVYIDSFDRPNISLKVKPGKEKIKDIIAFAKERKDESGIIYCLSRKSTEHVAKKLREEGVKAAHYHAGLPAKQRAATQRLFINDTIPIIVATIAFGMGIDKSNVRWVLHYNMPKNIEGYYQEIGRSGRDGMPAEAIMYYTFSDVISLRQMIAENTRKDVQLAKLERMQQYADALVCRRRVLLSYFHEELDDDCGNCDVCNDPVDTVDGTEIARIAIKAIAELNEGAASGLLIDIIRGSEKQEIKDAGYNKLKCYGTGKAHSVLDWKQFLLQMLNMGLIDIAYDDGNAVRLRPASNEVLYKDKGVRFAKPAILRRRAEEQKSELPPDPAGKSDEDLFGKLKKLRRSIAIRDKVPPYVVFSDASLQEMVEKLPRKKEDMKEISGVGETKLRNYGKLFADLIDHHVLEHGTPGDSRTTLEKTLDFFNQGHSLEKIAEDRDLNPMTIAGHIAQMYESGEEIDLERLLPEKTREKVVGYLEQNKPDLDVKSVYNGLGGSEKIPLIRLAIAWYNRNHGK